MKKFKKLKTNQYKIGIYVRVSTEEQAENPEGSIKTQEQRLREYIKLKNMVEPFGEVIHVFSDPGVSAKDMRRPGFQKMIKAITDHEIDMVLVTELSRFSRSTKDFTMLQEFLEENDCKFLSLRENFDTSGAAGSMVLNMMASIAEFERRQTAERVSLSFLARAKRGLYNGGSVPLGYKIDDNKPGYLLVEQETAEIVKLIFECFIKQGTLSATAKFLNAKGVKLPRRVYGGGSVRDSRFTIDMLYRTLKNKSYIGVRAFNTRSGAEEVAAVWKPIVDQEIFLRANKLLKGNRSQKRTHLEQRYPYTLSGLVFCEQCGDRMCGKSAHGYNKKVGYYEHGKSAKLQASHFERLPKHEPNRVPSEKLEPRVWEEVKRFIVSDLFVKDLLTRAKAMQEALNQMAEVDKLRQQSLRMKNQIDVLAERIGLLPRQMDVKPLIDQLTKLQAEKEALELRINDVEKSKPTPKDDPVSFESLSAFRNSVKKLISKGEIDKNIQAAIIKKVVHKIAIQSNGFEIHFHVGNNHYMRELGKTPGSRFFAFEPKKFDSGSMIRKVGSSTLLTNGDLGQNRTGDLQFRKLPLYPTELRGHEISFILNLRKAHRKMLCSGTGLAICRLCPFYELSFTHFAFTFSSVW